MNKIILYVVLVASIFFGGFVCGYYYNKSAIVTKEKKEVQVVVKKNEDVQTVSDKAEKTAIVYKDRVVTQYKTITKDVIKYVDKENSNPADVIWLDADWVRLHDASADAGNGEDEASKSTSIPDDSTNETGKVGVKSGKALEIIEANYQAYSNCRVELTGLQQYVLDLNKEFNK